MKAIRVRVLRADPSAGRQPWVESYSVPFSPGLSVADVLRYIQEEHDGSLAFYCSCKVGLCAGCTLKVNGKPCLACATPVEGDITVEPPPGRVVRDLMVEPQAPGSGGCGGGRDE